MSALIGVELLKLRKRWLPWILLGGYAVLYIVGQVSSYFIYKFPAQSGVTEAATTALLDALVFPSALVSAFDQVAGNGTPLLVALAAVAVGSEYSWGTVRQVLIKGAGRERYVISKTAAMALIAGGFVLVSLVLGLILGAVTTGLVKGSVDMSFLSVGFLGKVALMFIRAWFAIVVYVLLAVFVAIATRSTPAGLAIGLLYFFLESGIILLLTQLGGWIADVRAWLIGYNVQALLAHNRISEESIGAMQGQLGAAIPMAQLPGQLNAILVLLGYCVVFVAASLYIFRKRDVTA